MDELEERLCLAEYTLLEIIAPVKGRNHPDDTRIRGKIEGIRLAIRYLREERECLNP